MTANVLFAAHQDRWQQYEGPLTRALAAAGVNARLACDLPPPEVDYIVYAPNGVLQDFAPYTRAKAVLSLWAGVEGIVSNDTLKIPLARMVDPGLTKGMTEWVTGHVLRYHLGMDIDIERGDRRWQPRAVPLAPQRRVVILGLGALGRAAAEALAGLGFDVSGWSRRAKSLEGITCLHGAQGLEAALRRADILVTLLPDTPATENVLNARTLAMMPRGAFVINPGRGALIDDDALITALENGQVAHATLDVFRTEPLPPDHPFWAHPRLTVTPHIAAETRPETAATVIADNIRRGEAGAPFLHLVDREKGY